MSKLAPTMDAVLEIPFKVDSIAPVDAPAGSEGVWHSYVITQGTNTITGVRSGTRTEVAALLSEMVERLNERRMGKQRSKARG